MKGAENTNNNPSFIVCVLYFPFYFVFSDFPPSCKRLSNVIEMINFDGRSKKKKEKNTQSINKYVCVYVWKCQRNFLSIFGSKFCFFWLRKHLFMAFHTYILSIGILVDMLLILRFQTFDSGLIVE